MRSSTFSVVHKPSPDLISLSSNVRIASLVDAEFIFFFRFHDLIDDPEKFRAKRKAMTKPINAPSDPEVYIRDHISADIHRATCCTLKSYHFYLSVIRIIY